MRGLDYSTGPPSAAAVRAAGYEFVVRYVSTPGNPKNITAREFADMTGNGVAVALVFETTANRALSGYAGGQADARSAADQAAGVGMPGSRPIYFAVDFDAQPHQFGTIDDYLRGAASVVGIDRVGVYGSFSVVGHCLDVGTARYAWQTAAWSGGRADLRAHLFQRRGTVYVGGIACDVNDSNASDFGQWPCEEDDMFTDDDRELLRDVREQLAGYPGRQVGTYPGWETITFGEPSRQLTIVDLLREVHRQEQAAISLDGRPAGDVDNALGHLLSLRAELRLARAEISALTAAVAALASNENLTVAEITDIVHQAVSDHAQLTAVADGAEPEAESTSG